MISVSKVSEAPNVFNAATATGMLLRTIDERQKQIADGTAIDGMFNIPAVDDFITTMFPGTLTSVIGLPSNGKSFIMRYQALRIVMKLLELGDTKRGIIWVTAEESVEAIMAHFASAIAHVSSTLMMSGKMGDIEKRNLEAVVANVGSWPLHIIGQSLSSRDADGNRIMPADVTWDLIEAGIDEVINGKGIDPVAIFIDYLQRLQANKPGMSHEEHIRTSVSRSRSMANWTNSIAVLGVQAKQSVAQRDIAIPGMMDAEWTANVGQNSDIIMSVFIPAKFKMVGDIIEQIGRYKNIVVTKDMFFLYFPKQKDGPANEYFMFKAKPHLMQLEYISPEKYDMSNLVTTRTVHQIEDNISRENAEAIQKYQGEYKSMELGF